MRISPGSHIPGAGSGGGGCGEGLGRDFTQPSETAALCTQPLTAQESLTGPFLSCCHLQKTRHSMENYCPFQPRAGQPSQSLVTSQCPQGQLTPSSTTTALPLVPTELGLCCEWALPQTPPCCSTTQKGQLGASLKACFIPSQYPQTKWPRALLPRDPSSRPRLDSPYSGSGRVVSKASDSSKGLHPGSAAPLTPCSQELVWPWERPLWASISSSVKWA